MTKCKFPNGIKTGVCMFDSFICTKLVSGTMNIRLDVFSPPICCCDKIRHSFSAGNT